MLLLFFPFLTVLFPDCSMLVSNIIPCCIPYHVYKESHLKCSSCCKTIFASAKIYLRYYSQWPLGVKNSITRGLSTILPGNQPSLFSHFSILDCFRLCCFFVGGWYLQPGERETEVDYLHITSNILNIFSYIFSAAASGVRWKLTWWILILFLVPSIVKMYTI